MTAQHEAIKHNKLDVAELLVKTAPILLSIRNRQNCLALKLACDLGNFEAIMRLLKWGASIEGINLQDYSEEIQKALKKSSIK